jgi:hypothetical protein
MPIFLKPISAHCVADPPPRWSLPCRHTQPGRRRKALRGPLNPMPRRSGSCASGAGLPLLNQGLATVRPPCTFLFIKTPHVHKHQKISCRCDVGHTRMWIFTEFADWGRLPTDPMFQGRRPARRSRSCAPHSARAVSTGCSTNFVQSIGPRGVKLHFSLVRSEIS